MYVHSVQSKLSA